MLIMVIGTTFIELLIMGLTLPDEMTSDSVT
jgi:hypothetical protein